MAAKSTKKAAPKKVAKRTTKKATTKKATPKCAPKAKAKKNTAAKAKRTSMKAVPSRDRDPRLPKAGAILTRTFEGKEIKVEVLDAGFACDGKTWRSLSAIAKEVSGTSWNGFLFFGLQKRTKKEAK